MAIHDVEGLKLASSVQRVKIIVSLLGYDPNHRPYERQVRTMRQRLEVYYMEMKVEDCLSVVEGAFKQCNPIDYMFPPYFMRNINSKNHGTPSGIRTHVFTLRK